MKESRIFAPATIANMGPGFDIFGIALDSPGDYVEAKTTDKFKGVKLIDIINNPGLPLDENNVAQAVGQKVLDASKENIGIELTLYKLMHIGTGMGSSAASSVAAAVAVNNLLEKPFEKDDKNMINAVFHGEYIATKGSGHLDNVLPSLLGGFVFIDQSDYSYAKFKIEQSPYFVIASPDAVVETGEARRALKSAPYNIPNLVKNSAEIIKNHLDDKEIKRSNINLENIMKKGGKEDTVLKYIRGTLDVINGIRYNDIGQLGKGVMTDDIITPVRAEFIKGYDKVKEAALKAGAYGFSISGSGPSVFAITDTKENAYDLAAVMKKEFKKQGSKASIFISTVNNQGARDATADF